MAQLTTSAGSWREFDAWMGDKDRKKVANNTYAERRDNGDIAIRLHNTDILTFHDLSVNVTLNSGGWRTVTTKDRMNAILYPVTVYSIDGVWHVGLAAHRSEPLSAFYDGMVLNVVTGEMVSERLVDDGAKLKAQKKAINKYVKLYTDDRQAELVGQNGRLGDCLYCQFVTTDQPQLPLGDAFGSNDHLDLHIEEGYTMVSVMYNALKFVGYQDWQIPAVIRVPDIVRRAIRRYLVARTTTGDGSVGAGVRHAS